MNSLLLACAFVAIAAFVIGVSIGRLLTRRSLAARIAPHVASELDERTAVAPGTWAGFSRNRWSA